MIIDKDEMKTKLEIISKSHGLEPPKIMPWEVNRKELLLGVQWEKEHTENNDIAMIIALHHINEYEDYYRERMAKAVPDEWKEVMDVKDLKDRKNNK